MTSLFYGFKLQYYTNILVTEINGRTIGRVIIKRCGHEGRHPYLEGEDEATLRFLRAANSFIPDTEDDGADMKNAAFILRQPGREIVLKSEMVIGNMISVKTVTARFMADVYASHFFTTSMIRQRQQLYAFLSLQLVWFIICLGGLARR